ncbi:MAG: TatD family hydrolase [Acidobacteria bacterium]|nr:TatD family hydrolase [Acidobacteriota bacterium]
MFDTHAHLCAGEFASDLAAVVDRAVAAGVRAIVAVGEDLADARANLVLARRFPATVRPAAGLFPTHLDLEQADGLIAWIRRHQSELVAIGEVGLDYWKVQEEPEREIQREILRRFAALAQELDLPLNVHSRSAGRATIEALVASGARRVQMHAFDGRAANALPGVEAGFFFSVPPSIVRSEQKQKLVRRLPLSCLLLETDSPVLGTVPGERNEPARVVDALVAIAEVKEISRDEAREALAANTLHLYGQL